MPFIRRNFAPLGGQSTPSVPGTGESVPGAPQAFTYRTQDAATVVDTSGYFNEVRALLAPGDLIWRVTINASGVVQNAGWHVVMTRTPTAVDVADTAAVAVTNTD